MYLSSDKHRLCQTLQKMDATFFHINVIHSILIINCVVFTKANIFGLMKFNPHLHLTTPQVVKLHGYPVETHTVQSEDGFLLKLHRIPHGRSSKSKNSNRYPLLLCHEFLGSSFDWLLSGPDKSLGFRLPDEGYDVWLLNVRGNVYSYRNVRFTQIQYEYWNFTFHEEGIYDITASIDYILNVTCREKLIAIGHSLGNTAFYVMASMLPEYNHKVEAQISLAPVAAIPHSTSALFLLMHLFIVPIIIITKTLFSGACLPRNRLINLFTNFLCNYLTKEFCIIILATPLYGLDPFQFDRNLIPPYFAHVPAGSSLKNARHLAQIALPDAGFRQFDYGVLGNLANYGMPTPPAYNLSNIQVPIRAYYGDADIISKPIDTRAFYREIPKPLGLIRVNSITFNHIDFLGATDINTLLNDDVINFLNNVTDRADGSTFLNVTIRHSIKHRKTDISS